MKAPSQKRSPIHEIVYRPNARQYRKEEQLNGPRLIIDALFAICLLAVASCAWTKARQSQIQAVSEVALQHLAKDAYAIGLAAVTDEINSGFTSDIGYELQKNTREILPSLVSSQNLCDYLRAWNMKSTDELAKLVPLNLVPPATQKVALVLVDSQAAAIPAAE
jgi:hypothetical protein